MQTTFLYALRALQRGVVPVSETAWLFKIAENVCLAAHRTNGRRRERELAESPEELIDHSSDRDNGRDAARELVKALGTITPNQRQALLLREWRGLSYKEISSQLGVSVAAVETLIFRARKGVARALNGETSIRSRISGVVDLGAILNTLKVAFGGGATAAKIAAAAAVVTVAALPAADSPVTTGGATLRPPAAAVPSSSSRPLATSKATWVGKSVPMSRRGREKSRSSTTPPTRTTTAGANPTLPGSTTAPSGEGTHLTGPVGAPSLPPVPEIQVQVPAPALPPVILPTLPAVSVPTVPELPSIPPPPVHLPVQIPDPIGELPELPELTKLP